MSIQIKSLTSSAPVLDNSQSAANDNFNVIPSANQVYTLYMAPKDPNKTAIVKSIRLVNSHATATVKVSIYFNRPNSAGLNRRRFLAPVDMSLVPGTAFVDDGEITLEPGD